MIKYLCSTCGHTRDIPDEYQGRKFPCPKCKQDNVATQPPAIISVSNITERQGWIMIYLLAVIAAPVVISFVVFLGMLIMGIWRAL